jgi:hypothetical protein
MYIDTSTAEALLTRLRIGGYEQINGYEIRRLSDTEFTKLSQDDRREGRSPVNFRPGVGSTASVIPLLAEFVTATCDLQRRRHETCHCGERIHEQHFTTRTFLDTPWVHCDPAVGHGADIRPAAA